MIKPPENDSELDLLSEKDDTSLDLLADLKTQERAPQKKGIAVNQANPMIGTTAIGSNIGTSGLKKSDSIKVEDAPHLIAKAVSGSLWSLPERIAKRPMQFSVGGFPSISLDPYSKEEESQLPFPDPKSKAGGRLGAAVEALSGLIPFNTIVNSPKYLQMGKDIALKRVGGADKALEKAQDEMIRLLQPPIKEMDVASDFMRYAPQSIEEAVKYVKPSKNYKELAKNLRNTQRQAVQIRNAKIRGDNFDIQSDEYLEPLKRMILSEFKKPEASPDDIRDMLKIYDRFKSMKPSMSRMAAQTSKTRLQRETEAILKKSQQGQPTNRSSAEMRALHSIRQGLKKSVEGGDSEIAELNKAWSGLRGATKLANRQFNLARKAPNPSLYDKIVGSSFLSRFGGPKAYPMQIAREAIKREPSLYSKTRKISDLYDLYRYGTRVKAAPVNVESGLRQLSSDAIIPKLLTSPKSVKRLGVSGSYGPGFTRAVSPEEIEMARQFAFAQKLGVSDIPRNKINPERILRLGREEIFR